VDRKKNGGYNLIAMDFQAKPRVLISRLEIEAAVSRLAAEINKDYRGKHPVLVAVLKGSFVFLADLVRRLEMPLEVEFVRLSSYGRGRQSSGKVRLVYGLDVDVQGRDVLVVEDIIDTGLTTGFLLDYLRRKQPASIKVCALTSKPSRRQCQVDIDYLGFTVPDKFIVGYGIDYSENFRHLPDICVVEEE
jgi:hypoxanthine phosphoribosyltransferase